jgi:mRNA interferase RelE/StbE
MRKYKVYITPRALREVKNLPGHIRQRVRRAIRDLADDPHPSNSKVLEVTDIDSELCRLKLDSWRVVYAITEIDSTIDVLAVRKRPPYDYGDLTTLLKEIH